MRYKDCKPIRPSKTTAWRVTFGDGKVLLSLFHEEATVEEVVEYTKTHHPKFSFYVQVVGVGEFELVNSARDSYYLSDTRKVNENMEVVI